MKEVKEQMSWEVERSNVALKKLQDWYSSHTRLHTHTQELPFITEAKDLYVVLFCSRFRDSFASVVSVEAIGTSHSVSTFHVPALVTSSLQLREGSRLSHLDEDGEGDYEAVPEYGESQAELAKDGIEAEGEEVGEKEWEVGLIEDSPAVISSASAMEKKRTASLSGMSLVSHPFPFFR